MAPTASSFRLELADGHTSGLRDEVLAVMAIKPEQRRYQDQQRQKINHQVRPHARAEGNDNVLWRP